MASTSGAQLFLLTSGSAFAVPAAAPSTVITATGLAGAAAGYAYGTYDPKDNLVILPDADNNLEILDGSTFRLKSFTQFPGVGPVIYSNAGYMGYMTYTLF